MLRPRRVTRFAPTTVFPDPGVDEHSEVVIKQRVKRLLLDRTQVSLEANIERCPVRALVIDFQGYAEFGEQAL